MKVEGMMSGQEIRSEFLTYFKQKGHTIVSSSALVPHDDPTLLFTNAGMNQFKDVFTGKAKRPYTKAASAQKVVRAGGKHNDLENVGRTSRHHTFFEMLGNFSFGDYFKKEAISYAWDFLVNTLSLPKEKLFVTVYKDDDEAYAIWRDDIGLSEDKIIKRGEKDNFWQMGDTGPCGPCSEIHIDQGENTGCMQESCSPECDCDRHLELWNLVFMQYERSADGTLNPLPKPSIDTGMGLERIASVLQGVTSNYDTDLFLPIIDYCGALSKIKYKEDPKKDISLRVIADHARSTAFLISDGVIPSNEGRGYVLRRIMRRAMRHGYILGFSESFFYKVCLFVADFMKGHYSELMDNAALIEKVVKAEEDSFSKTLASGMKMLDEEILAKREKGSTIEGELIFKFYDTYGFPVDLLTDILEDEGYKYDMENFEKHMAAQQERARKAGHTGAQKGLSDEFIKIGSEFETTFDGYMNVKGSGRVEAILDSNGNRLNSSSEGDVNIILDRTVFYAEGGGQSGDKGVMKSPKCQLNVMDTKQVGNAFIHQCRLINGSISVGDPLDLEVDIERRRAVTKNHTATHLLFKALQIVLGDHIKQAGSSTTPEEVRFDFTHYSQLTTEEIDKISDLVNKVIDKGVDVVKKSMPIQEALDEGATALFGEKYGDVVRIIDVDGFSKEFCKGTHVNNTAEIGVFVITSESSIASGVRRIEALTGYQAYKYLSDRSLNLLKSANNLKCSVKELPDRILDLQKELKDSQRELKQLQSLQAVAKAKSLINLKEVNNIKIITFRLDNIGMESLKDAVENIFNDHNSSSIIFGAAVDGEKVNFVCRVSEDISKEHKAGSIIKKIAAIAGGSGGGKDTLAQAGAKDITKVNEALESVYSILS